MLNVRHPHESHEGVFLTKVEVYSMFIMTIPKVYEKEGYGFVLLYPWLLKRKDIMNIALSLFFVDLDVRTMFIMKIILL